MPDVRQKLITDAVVARAETLANLVVFRGEVDAPLPTLGNSDRVGRYVVIYAFGGSDGPDPNLGDTTGDLAYGFQINCAAGFEADCEFLVDQVRGLFNRWTPASTGPLTGLVFGAFRPPPGYQSGPARRNDSVKPPRFWLPLQYQIVATTTSA